jgi:hypothetical protein
MANAYRFLNGVARNDRSPTPRRVTKVSCSRQTKPLGDWRGSEIVSNVVSGEATIVPLGAAGDTDLRMGFLSRNRHGSVTMAR